MTDFFGHVLNKPVSELKSQLRAEARARRREVTDPGGAGAAMAMHAMDVLERSERVAVYISYGHEPSTNPLIAMLASDGIEVLAPRMSGDELEWCVIDLDTQWTLHERGIKEPIGSASNATPDAVIVPALAVDPSGNRLGQGKGYYDRYLSTLPDSVLCIAFVFDDDVIDEVPTEPHDHPMNIIVTEKRLIAIS